ncbi:hypothetical protein GWI33_023037 [Rhynchophorus ferrugineus]|uniref:GON-4-like protein n=1 Tax=Rhynchophorus ferrugineus TaxID=354439 RepID=A0A834HRM4_RHYFE|nr:hypothetical protein GWI33_023037 [Rhynchophorus ferrugineus]
MEYVCNTSLANHTESDSDSSSTDSNLEINIERIIIPGCVTSPKSINENDIEMFEDRIIEKRNKNKFSNNKSVINQQTLPAAAEHGQSVITETKDIHKNKDFVPQRKLTRAKTKELLSSATIPSVAPYWIPQPPPSETHILIGEDLKEDDSGDEYVPGDEDDKSAASESDTSSLPPPTPPTPISLEDIGTHTTYTDDGVFKIPPPKFTDETEHVANIALRTRSKINLSSTPLEEIEKSFIPPDITTDMYDLDCDDDVWKDFLKTFTQPLDEMNRPNDDEEHDPEYNILADEINELDEEEIRIDRGVKVTKKEIKKLWDELFDYLQDMSHIPEGVENQQLIETDFPLNGNGFIASSDQLKLKGQPENVTKEPKVVQIQQHQLNILEQQMRQHIQMLTQNFLLTYSVPGFHEKSFQFRDHLVSAVLSRYRSNSKALTWGTPAEMGLITFYMDLKKHADGRDMSVFKQSNLLPAIKVVDDWIKLFAENVKEVVDCREHVTTEMAKSMQYKLAGNTAYILTFPRLLLETVGKSDVFMYPYLLPKVPFRLEQFFGNKTKFTDAEDRLLVFGLDDFTKMLEEEKKSEKIKLKEKVALVQQFIMPHRKVQVLMRHIFKSKHPKSAPNPIQQYFTLGTLSPVTHLLYPNPVLPPCQRLPGELPYQWRMFLYQETLKPILPKPVR